jgi:hypothetical protein
MVGQRWLKKVLMNNNIEVLHEKIWVFKNAFKKATELINFLELQTDEWTGWYTFGSKIELTNQSYQEDHFPESAEEWKEKVLDKMPDDPLKDFAATFYEVTSQYVNSLGVELDNWLFIGTDVCKYDTTPTDNFSDTHAMNYHTDYRLGRTRFPGHKFDLTCVFYLNEGYEGGEISFRIFNQELTKLENIIDYKPSKGDVIIFPSKHPFYHGVKKLDSGEKYIVRSYWRHNSAGDPKLQEEKERYLVDHTEQEWDKLAQKKENELFNTYSRRIQVVLDPESVEDLEKEFEKLDIDPYKIRYE